MSNRVVRISKRQRGYLVGYCHSSKHSGYISKEAADFHECAYKQCSCLQKYNCKYWREQDADISRVLIKIYYKQHKDLKGKMSISTFKSLCTRYYGGYANIPRKKGKLLINNFIEYLERVGKL